MARVADQPDPQLKELPTTSGRGEAASAEAAVTVIRPDTGWQAIGWRELCRYRELLYFLAWRDVKVRYKQTALGAAWAILQPVLTMAIFTVVFGHFAKIPSDGIPYALFSFCGLLPWTFFAYTMTQSSNSLVENANLISKVHFPRLVIP